MAFDQTLCFGAGCIGAVLYVAVDIEHARVLAAVVQGAFAE